jgi:hypothetical protein
VPPTPIPETTAPEKEVVSPKKSPLTETAPAAESGSKFSLNRTTCAFVEEVMNRAAAATPKHIIVFLVIIVIICEQLRFKVLMIQLWD